jgi:hypothetical protein
MKPVDAAPELMAILCQPENQPFLEFHEYWRRKAAGKAMLSRGDLDPLEIPQLLPGIFLVDVVPGPPRRFRFRLVGTRIAELEGEMTGKFLDEFVPGSPGTAMALHYEDAAEGRISIRRETLCWHARERQHVNYDVLLLPLSRDGATIDMLFGFCLYHVA